MITAGHHLLICHRRECFPGQRVLGGVVGPSPDGSGEAPGLDSSRMFWAWCLGGKGAHKTGEVAKHLVHGALTDSRRRRTRTACSTGKPQGLGGECLFVWAEEKENWGRENWGICKNKRDKHLCKEKSNQVSFHTHKHTIIKEKSILMNGTFHKEIFLRQISEATEMKHFFLI